MYIAAETPIDDPELVDYGGSLMQWHVHTNLCWAPNDQGVLQVVAITDDHGGTCPPDTIHAGGDSPMVHVWIAPHECGPFAALEMRQQRIVVADVDPGDVRRLDHVETRPGSNSPASSRITTEPMLPAAPVTRTRRVIR